MENRITLERKNKDIYIEDDRVIKLFKKNHPKSQVLNEALNLARVEESSNLNVPKLIEVKKINNRWALITERIEGKTLSDLIREDVSKLDFYLDLFVDIQLTVLNNHVPMLNRIKEKFKNKLEDTNLIDNNTKYELLERLQGMKNHTFLCHGDFHPSNIIVDKDGRVYIIDWSHVTQGNKSADCARTYLLFAMDNHLDVAEKYLDKFSKKSNISKKEIQNWIPIVAATELTKNIPEEKEFLEKWINVVDYN